MKKADDLLLVSNARLVNPSCWGPNGASRLGRAILSVEKIDKKKRTPLPSLLATFCPFCGVKYEDGKEGS
jgi:hypothetical protein